MELNKTFYRRVFMSLFGVVICAISVGIFKIAALGVDPFQSLMAGLDKLIPIPFGTLYVIVNVLLLTFSLIADRKNIGIATFINLFLLGYITQFTYEFLQTIIINPSMIVRLACLLIAIVIICFGSAFYMTANLGVSTYDADVICVILGSVIFVMGGGAIKEIPTIVGIGTIITAFFMGPLIEFFNVKIARPFLAKAEE